MNPFEPSELSPTALTAIVSLSFAIAIFYTITTWKIFTKAGQPGWAALIPIYNVVIMFRVASMSGWWTLTLLAAIIPLLGTIFQLGVIIYALHRISLNFGRSAAFTIGLVLLSFIFMPILAFGASRYHDRSGA